MPGLKRARTKVPGKTAPKKTQANPRANRSKGLLPRTRKNPIQTNRLEISKASKKKRPAIRLSDRKRHNSKVASGEPERNKNPRSTNRRILSRIRPLGIKEIAQNRKQPIRGILRV